jgi:glycosyltransferase involved in cell wall biosynthesis
LQRFKPSLGYIDFIRQHHTVTFIAFINGEGEKILDSVKYLFFKGYKSLFFTPLKMLRYVKKEEADVILVQGLANPFQVICLRLMVGKKPAIIVQHHGEQPLKGTRKMLQKLADRYINGYLFTSKGNAQFWIDEGMISTQAKCYEVLEASTFFTPQNREACRAKYNITGDYNFLWVGRLNENKDPLTALTGFEKYLAVNREARLYMIYQATELLDEMKAAIDKSTVLKSAVVLVGEVPHEELPCWYTAADFYLSASHREGSGYALIEAMACGCIPVVTDIPSFRAITGGSNGILYKKGNSDALLQALIKAGAINRHEASNDTMRYFEEHLSFKSIADNVLEVCKQLTH